MHVINVVVQAHYSCRFIKCAVTCFHLREASLRLAFDKYNTFVINLTFMGPCILRICNICPTRCNVTQFILSGNCSICFGWYHHPSSGTQITVSTASGICHTVTAICRYRGRVGTGLSVLWVAYATHSTLNPVPTLP